MCVADPKSYLALTYLNDSKILIAALIAEVVYTMKNSFKQ